MKRTKKLVAATMLLGLTTGGLNPAVYAEDFDGVNTGDIQIQGSIGKLDNTDPTTNLPEGSDDWINVTVDTATAFHTTSASNHVDIESATYNISNNSGRGVAVYLNGISGTPTYVDQLTIVPDDSQKALQTTPQAVDLVSSGAFTTLAATPWLVLANNQGELEINSAQDFGNAVTFSYTGKTGTLPADITTATPENYTLTLKFVSVQADGTTIGQ